MNRNLLSKLFGLAIATALISMPDSVHGLTLSSASSNSSGFVGEQFRATRQETTEAEDVEEDDLEGSGEYENGAPLKTDPDLMSALEKAEQYRMDGNYRVASKLWQNVLAQSGDTLFTDDDETYFALTEKVEKILAELPASGLSTYRISADASASEIMAQAKNKTDIEALSKVVKGYFVSSEGDDAAYRLACIYMDRYDFVGAVRLFRKITDRYPDPSVPLSDVWLKIAICYTYVGDVEQAKLAISKAEDLDAETDSDLFLAVTRLTNETPQNSGANTGGVWPNRLGDLKRTGIMPSVPTELDGKNLMADWQYYYTPRTSYKNDEYEGRTASSKDAELLLKSVSKKEETLITAWRKNLWRPSGVLLFSENHTVYRTGSDITVWNRRGDVASRSEPIWRPLWQNQFYLDPATAAWKNLYKNYGNGNKTGRFKTAPEKPEHVQIFGDQIAQSMSIHRGVIYCIEGQEYTGTPPRNTNQQDTPWGSVPRRTRTNRLSAYNINNGKMMWRLPTVDLLRVAKKATEVKEVSADVSEEEKEKFKDVGFMAAPVGFGDLLLVPANVNGSIWVYALDSRQQGKLAWKSYLCDEPGGGSQPWSPIHISVDGSTAYVNCGTGVVFAVDSMTGSIRFARRYARTGESNDMMRQSNGYGEIMELDGWQEDLIIPYGNEMLLFASDYNVIWSANRQTAAFNWKTDNRPFGNKFDYLIGIHNDMIYVGGSKSVAAVGIKSQGRWEWVHNFKDGESFGRAMLTPDGVYVPVDNKIVKLDLLGDDGVSKVLAEMDVNLGIDAPLGNLYCDGKRLWVHGANRLYTLTEDDGSMDSNKTPAKPEADSKGEVEGDSSEEEEGDSSSLPQ